MAMMKGFALGNSLDTIIKQFEYQSLWWARGGIVLFIREVIY